jgi:hypothetical protein
VTEHFRGSGRHKYIKKRCKQGGIEALATSVSYKLTDFESQPKPTHQFWKPARAKIPILKASQSQFTDFESQTEPTRWFWKLARANLASFLKLFANSKAFPAKRQRIY